MAITDPTIDPATGLPVLGTLGIVQQIPLGRQTVDYAGWNASAQPTRTPLYPDDVIPVFANVQGQHPTTGNAQNVGTDGKNALLVRDVGGGGGGPGIVSLHHQDVWNTQGIAPSQTANLGSYGVITSLWGFSFAVTSVTGTNGLVWFRNSVSHSVLWSLPFGCGPNGQFFFCQLFPYGIKPSADMGPDELIDQLYVTASGTDAIAGASIWWK